MCPTIKIKYNIFIILFLVLSLPIVYNTLFPIHENKIQSFLEQHVGVQGIKIVKALDIDNKKIVIYEFRTGSGQFLGDAELTKGLNNRYQFNRTGYSQNIVRNRIMETNGGKYLLVVGENQEGTLSAIQVVVRETEFTRAIPNENYYVIAIPLPGHTKGNFADFLLLKNKGGTTVYKNILL